MKALQDLHRSQENLSLCATRMCFRAIMPASKPEKSLPTVSCLGGTGIGAMAGRINRLLEPAVAKKPTKTDVCFLPAPRHEAVSEFESAAADTAATRGRTSHDLATTQQAQRPVKFDAGSHTMMSFVNSEAVCVYFQSANALN